MLSTTAASPWIHITPVAGRDGVVLLEMKHKPVNALSLEFVRELTAAVQRLEDDKSIKALVLCSAIPTIFSAGLDIREMYQKDESHLRSFWTALQDLWIKMMTTRLATAAAIEGHSPAGGCLLALTCDERVMTSAKATIGLNETRLGIVAPSWFISNFVSCVGQRQADRMLQCGEMVLAGEALAVGLVDALAAADQVRTMAAAALDRYLQVPETARLLTKHAVRHHIVDSLASHRERDTNKFVGLITQPQVQKGLGAYLESIAKRAKEVNAKL